MTSPAERILAAADLLASRASEATEQVAGYRPGDYYHGVNYSQIQRDGMGGKIGEFAATMHPGVGKWLVEWLREEAAEAAIYKGKSPAHLFRYALGLADRVLGGGEQS